MSTLRFSVEGVCSSGYRVELRARSHTWVLDEPRDMGGGDAGPNPIEALLGALIGCVSAVTRLHASRKGVALTRIEARAEAEVDPRGFVGAAKPGLRNVKLHVVVEGDAPSEELAGLVREAEKCCPIADTLASETPVELSVEARGR